MIAKAQADSVCAFFFTQVADLAVTEPAGSLSLSKCPSSEEWAGKNKMRNFSRYKNFSFYFSCLAERPFEGLGA